MNDTPNRKALRAPELTGADWFKSSYSGGEQACIEIADLRTSVYASVAVRDSKDPNGPALLFAPGAFAALVQDAAHGRYGAI